MFKEELILNNMNLTLDKIEIGNRYSVVSIPTGTLRSQLLRLGISEGQAIFCLSRLPGGTMVIKLNRQEIALGSTLAKKIMVKFIK
jgi:Fe2+ transport system protein FeoA